LFIHSWIGPRAWGRKYNRLIGFVCLPDRTPRLGTEDLESWEFAC